MEGTNYVTYQRPCAFVKGAPEKIQGDIMKTGRDPASVPSGIFSESLCFISGSTSSSYSFLISEQDDSARPNNAATVKYLIFVSFII